MLFGGEDWGEQRGDTEILDSGFWRPAYGAGTTMIVVSQLSNEPSLSMTVSAGKYVPGSMYVWYTSGVEAFDPSLKRHSYRIRKPPFVAKAVEWKRIGVPTY